MDWDKDKYNLIFDIKTANVDFNVIYKPIQFSLKKHNIIFNVCVFDKVFSTKTYDIKFTANIVV